MHIFAIGDLHLDSKMKKPMDIFGENWFNHDNKIFDNWKTVVRDEDLVLIPGDISWAMKLEEAKEDLEIIDNLPGKKIMIRGNHDYWWSTKNKLSKLKLKSISFINNDLCKIGDIVICGTRGWSKDDSLDDEMCIFNDKIFNRELERFKMSLELTKKGNCKKIAMLHYPPFNIDKSPNDFVYMMEKYNIDVCVYGHLHGKEGHKLVREGKINNINFVCVSSDYIDFKLKEIVL